MNTPPDGPWVLRSRRVYLPAGPTAASVHVRAGRIERVAAHDETPDGARVVDVGDLAVLPGLVDSHVHINEPGRTEWEGFRTATRAAAAGGVTTLVDMPLNSLPPTTTAAGLDAKRRAADGKLHVDVGFTGGLIRGGAGEMRALAREGVLSVKCFLADSGVPEFPHVEREDLEAAMPILADLGRPLFVHAELPGPLEAAERTFGAATASDLRKYSTWLRARPRAAEDEAIALLYELCEATSCRTHVVHLSSSDALPIFRAAKDRRIPLSAETCPHYLHFDAEHIHDGATQHKCAPPIREAANRDALWGGLRGGLIDMVVSDHSPCTPELKRLEEGDFMAAWGGIASVGFGLPVIWTHAAEQGIALQTLVHWMCEAPAELVGLTGRKGRIAPGADADLVVFDPAEAWELDPSLVFHRHRTSPYLGAKLLGKVHTTYLRGEPVYDAGEFVSPPRGRMLP